MKPATPTTKASRHLFPRAAHEPIKHKPMMPLSGLFMNAFEQHYLSVGASAWKVADALVSLTRVVGDEAQAAFNAAIELGETWSGAFGRNGDPYDARDHAINAPGVPRRA